MPQLLLANIITKAAPEMLPEHVYNRASHNYKSHEITKANPLYEMQGCSFHLDSKMTKVVIPIVFDALSFITACICIIVYLLRLW